MPEKGTSLMSEMPSPVKKPRYPSFLTIYLLASIMPEYSVKPTTSNRVLITTNGLETTDCIVLANALEANCICYSFLNPTSLREFSE